MRKTFHVGRWVTMFVLVAVVGFGLINHFYKRPWQIEAERLVRKDFPVRISLSQLEKIAIHKGYFLRTLDDVEGITALIPDHKLKIKLGWLYDSVAVDVYFDSDGKVQGYSEAYGARTAWL